MSTRYVRYHTNVHGFHTPYGDRRNNFDKTSCCFACLACAMIRDPSLSIASNAFHGVLTASLTLRTIVFYIEIAAISPSWSVKPVNFCEQREIMNILFFWLMSVWYRASAAMMVSV